MKQESTVARLAAAIGLVSSVAAAVALAAATAFLWLLGVTVKDEFTPGEYLSISSVWATLLLVAVAGGVLLALRLALLPRGPAYAFVAALALLAADELLLLHGRLAASPATAGTVAYALAVGLAVALGFGLGRALPQKARLAWLAGAAAWTAAVAVALTQPGNGTRLHSLQELLEMLGTAALLVGVVILVSRSAFAQRPRDAWSVGLELAAGVDAARLARALAVIIAVLAVLAALVMNGLDSHTFDFREEETIPAYFSAGLQLAAAACAVLLIPWGARVGIAAFWLVILAGCLALLAFDELASIHERLNVRTGVPGQFFLLPFVLVAGVAMVRVLARLTDRRAKMLLVGGIVLSVLSQALDMMPGRPEDLLNWFFFVEETCELVGLSLLLLGLLLAVQTTRTDARQSAAAGLAAAPTAAAS